MKGPVLVAGGYTRAIMIASVCIRFSLSEEAR
jgi:hypothetical protein